MGPSIVPGNRMSIHYIFALIIYSFCVKHREILVNSYSTKNKIWLRGL